MVLALMDMFFVDITSMLQCPKFWQKHTPIRRHI